MMALRARRGLSAPAFGGEALLAWMKGHLYTLVGCAVLIVTGLWIYWPAIHGGWLWDDGLYIVDNPFVHSPDGYWKVWLNLNPLGSHYPGNYNPLTTLTEWLEWRLWGNDTLGYHLVNIALHVTSAVLLWRLFARLGFSFAWLGAMIFLVHPVQVESVAWISELKNTLALPPLLMALLMWLDYEEKGGRDHYRSAILWYVLSVAAKSSGLMMPIVMLVHAWWKKGRITIQDARNVAPFFAISLLVGLIMLMPSHLTGAHLIVQPTWSFASCFASVGWTVVFLWGKCFFPVGLLPQYRGFTIMHPTAFDLVPWLLLLVCTLLFAVGWRRAPWIRPVAFGLGFFALHLIPILILIATTYAVAAWTMDHLVYLPIIGLIGWAIDWLARLYRWLPSSAQAWEWAGLGALLLVFCWGSHSYARIFTNQELFWTYAVAGDPQNWQTHDNLGKFYGTVKRPVEAIEQFRKAVELRPDSDQAHYDLGLALNHAGKAAEAKEHLLVAAALNPPEMRAYLALAGISQEEGNFPEAEKYITQARSAAPRESTPVAALASLRIETGRKKEGLELYAEALKMTPDVMELRYNYGMALQENGDFPQAVEQLQAAVDLNDQFAPSRENLGTTLARMGKIPEAILQFKAALKINPGYLSARKNLGLAYAQTGNLEGAIEQFRKATEINPNDLEARDSLDKLLKVQASLLEKSASPASHP